jgi:AcrR family transcriptional regulator
VEFGALGFERASIVSITGRAGVAQGTFYTYFPHKEAIFAELVRELSHRVREHISQAIAGLDHRADVEREGFRAFLEFIAEHRDLYRIVRNAEFVDEALYRWYYDSFAEGYVRGLGEARDAGQVDVPHPEAVAWCLMGIADFLGMRWVLWGDGPVPDEVFDAVMTFVRRGFGRAEGEGSR